MRRSLLLLAGALAAGLAGCGDSSSDHAAMSQAAVIRAHHLAVDPARANARPEIKGPKLLEIRRTGDQFGTSDVVTYARDGSAVVIRSYGGGGYYAVECTLSGRELARLVRDIGRLPLGRAPHVRERPRQSFYTLPAASYVVERGHYVGSFTVDAVPADGRPMMRHLTRLLAGHEGHCRKTYATRTT